MPIPLVAAGTSSAWLPYLLALGAGGTYAMNRDRLNRMAGSFNIPWPGRETAEERWLRTGSFEEPTVITARPDATNSEMDARQIISSGGGPGGSGGNNGGNWDQDPRFLRGARYGELPAKFASDQISNVVERFLQGSEEVDPYEAGAIEREENEWGPGGQPSASEQSRIYEQSGWRNSPSYRNSPAARSGVFTDDELGRQKELHDAFKQAQRTGTMDEFVEAYPQSQTAKEYAIRNRIPSSLDMEF